MSHKNDVWDELEAAWKENTLERVHAAVYAAIRRGRALDGMIDGFLAIPAISNPKRAFWINQVFTWTAIVVAIAFGWSLGIWK